MNRIISKSRLSENVYKMQLEAPLVAQERKAGQFVILMVDDEFGERIPLTIADADSGRGTITVIFQTVGATTTKLSRLEPGDSIAALLGPLGRPTSIRGENGEKPGHVVCVGGGIGVAPMHPIAQALKAAGNKVTIIMGARNEGLFVMKDESISILSRFMRQSSRNGLKEKSLETVATSYMNLAQMLQITCMLWNQQPYRQSGLIKSHQKTELT